MPNYQSLATELKTDPLKLGYAGITGGLTNHNELAAMLNALTGAGAGSVSLPSIGGDTFKKLVFPAVMVLPSSPVQTKWSDMLQWLASATTIVVDGEFTATMNALITDVGALTGVNGVPALNTARITQYTTRPASRAELLSPAFFDAVGLTQQIVSPADIAKAIN